MQEGELVITASSYKKIQAELEEIYTEIRPQVIERVRQARLLGDLRENADYDDAKMAQAMLESRIAELKHILGTARIVEDSEMPEGCVGLGSTVKVLDLDENEEEDYTIVGAVEANPMEGKISNQSNVGKALMGKQVDDEVEIDVPMGTLRYRILSVE
jgi:transcription elongation factor GreA